MATTPGPLTALTELRSPVPDERNPTSPALDEIPWRAMDARGTVEVVTDSRYGEHRGPTGHPERPERLEAVGAALDACGDALVRRAPRAAEPEELLAVHEREHIEHVQRASEAGRGRLDPDTFVSRASYDVALLAAGGSIDLALRIARGDVRSGFAAVRPPGHHAEGDRAMGFCLFNNAAIAARAVQRQAGVERVALVDWDVHHGNGTQHTFESDPSVLYVSTHQYPFYPGTGAAGELGVGRGEGATLNVPMPAGCGDAEYVGVFQRVLIPAARAFRPDYWIVSCGFDAHAEDPLAAMHVSRAGYSALTAVVRALADELSGGRLLFVLEGGYSLVGLREGMEAVLEGLLSAEPVLPAGGNLLPGSVLSGLIERTHAVHGRWIPGLGSL
jgi:acetoin utilization deacetylase AcuC-like enzyme